MDPHRSLLYRVPGKISHLQKFVSTTLRPTLMPYPELYNWDTCAQFVSDFLTMIPLVDPLKPVSATPWLHKASPAGLRQVWLIENQPGSSLLRHL